MLAAQLNDLGVKPMENGASKQSGHHHHPTNILDPLDSSDEDDDDEEDDSTGNAAAKSGLAKKRQPNDGTLLASDPPKPLYVLVHDVLVFFNDFVSYQRCLIHSRLPSLPFSVSLYVA